ncbi:ABC transporter permease [Clostridium oryzae]|uniref:Putative multiple-sugar transport system permease YteP n=1 Tax=Clostridium oryzae TaxID=1450648 RepID=A0A1V4IUC4_9CLOT|nr:ABC transporter permease subunit [Clostridium oryzae]OPJ63536.1 putative multiple-sugar transport system permease YteP [Clostridium oryzae]
MQNNIQVKRSTHKKKPTKSLISRVYDQKSLFLMSIPFVIWLVIFRYLPLWGWTMAFQNYKPNLTFGQQEWVGLEQFTKLFNDPTFYQALRNTLAMSFLSITFGFITPIIFAILLNEIRHSLFKRFIQTVSYLPHFVSWVIAATLITTMLSVDSSGIVNQFLLKVHIIANPINFMAIPKAFWWIVTGADLWKEVGWNSIIYLAAITGIDMELYDAAKVDGAGRFRQIWNVTLPGIRSTIIVILIMNIGWLINIGFEKQYLLGNAIVMDYANVLDYYALQYGINLGRYSYGTAIGIFKSVISVILVVAANKFAKRIGEGEIM